MYRFYHYHYHHHHHRYRCCCYHHCCYRRYWRPKRCLFASAAADWQRATATCSFPDLLARCSHVCCWCLLVMAPSALFHNYDPVGGFVQVDCLWARQNCHRVRCVPGEPFFSRCWLMVPPESAEVEEASAMVIFLLEFFVVVVLLLKVCLYINYNLYGTLW